MGGLGEEGDPALREYVLAEREPVLAQNGHGTRTTFSRRSGGARHKAPWVRSSIVLATTSKLFRLCSR